MVVFIIRRIVDDKHQLKYDHKCHAVYPLSYAQK